MQFLEGMVFMAVFIGLNDAAKHVMTKVKQNNEPELKKMKIWGYPIYSYVRFKIGMDNETVE